MLAQIFSIGLIWDYKEANSLVSSLSPGGPGLSHINSERKHVYKDVAEAFEIPFGMREDPRIV